MGADEAINYREADWGEVLKGQGFDLIFATVNDEKPSGAWERAQGVLKAGGSYVCLLGGPKEVDPAGPKYTFMLTDSTATADLVRICMLVTEGKVRPVLHGGEPFAFDAAGWEGMVAVNQSGRAKGKLAFAMEALLNQKA